MLRWSIHFRPKPPSDLEGGRVFKARFSFIISAAIMITFFRILWRLIVLLFRAIGRVFVFFFRLPGRIYHFLTFEPEDRPVTEVLASTFKQPAAIWEHVEALRRHLLRMLVAVMIGVGICALYTAQIINFLAGPIGGIDKLQAIDPTETIGVFMRVALFGGLGLALPYIAFELWLFAAPGISARSRRIGLLGIPLTTLFFLGGVFFSYRFFLPSALPFLLQFLGIHTIPRVSSYLDVVTNLLFWIGISFEFPLVIYVLTGMGLIKPQPLLRQWRIAVVAIAIVAAAITPTVDPVNMSLVMAPMVLLYFFSVLLSFIAAAGRRREKDNKSD